jgi:hypothetical protein
VTSCPCMGRFRLHGSQQDVRAILEQTHAFLPVQRMHEGISAGIGRFTLRQSRVEWRKNPQHDSSQRFYLHALGLTFFTHATACIPSIQKLFVLPKELRIKHIIHMSFGIILKYYSQGPESLILTLSPFSHLPAPNPLPTLWKISPPSLIQRGQSARGGVYILLLFHIIQVQNQAFSLQHLDSLA